MTHDHHREPLDPNKTLFDNEPSLTLREAHDQIRAIIDRLSFRDAMEVAPSMVVYLTVMTIERHDQDRAIDNIAGEMKRHAADFERYRNDPEANPLHDVEGSA